MSRKVRSQRRSARPSGVALPTFVAEQRTADLAATFDSQLRSAANDNPVDNRAPYAAVQTIVPGANERGNPKTREAYDRIADMKRGVDPGLNQKFETATAAREYRRRNAVESVSAGEFRQMMGQTSSMRRSIPMPNGPPPEGFNPGAFQKFNELGGRFGR